MPEDQLPTSRDEPRPPRRRRAAKRPPPGTDQGAIVTDPAAPAPVIRAIAYGPDELVERPLATPEQIPSLLGDHPVTWIDVDGLGDAAVVSRIGQLLGMHKLSLADVVHVHQRPKVEDFAGYLFLVARMPRTENGRLATEQVSIVLGREFVVTFQEREVPGDVFEPVRDRLRRNIGAIRRSGPDFLAQALLDVVIDSYFPVLEGVGDDLDELEERVLDDSRDASLHELHRIKRDLITVRRAAWPLREATSALSRDASELIREGTRPYLRDCHDHAVQIIDLVESYRDLESGLMEVYLSTVSNRLNETMKVLTVIATIFIPLTFIAGVYGMNFDPDASPFNMPELRWRYGYPLSLALMALVAGAMLGFFWRRGWLGGRDRRTRRRPWHRRLGPAHEKSPADRPG